MTLPVGVPLPGAMADTVALKVTAWPYTEGSVSEMSEVVVFAWLTTWLKAVEALDVKLASPPNDTVIDWVATPRLEVVRLALPPLNVAVPKGARAVFEGDRTRRRSTPRRRGGDQGCKGD